MRHTPTALYLDTEVIRGAGFHLDTGVLQTLRETFVQGGLRLLLPKVMERELLRQFKIRSDDSAAAFTKAARDTLIKAAGVGNPLQEGQLAQRCLNALKEQWETFKAHFHVEALPLVGNFEEVIDWYFECRAPFSPKKKYEFPDAFILSTLDEYYRQYGARVAVVSQDQDFAAACSLRRYLVHFSTLRQYIDSFKPVVSRSGEGELVDPTVPITTEDLTEIQAMLRRGDDVISSEITRVLQLLKGRGSNYEYFFRNAKSTVWLEPLRAGGFFDNPPAVERLDDGSVRSFPWWPVEYLQHVFPQDQRKVLEVFAAMQPTDNRHVLGCIVDMVAASKDASVLDELYARVDAYLDTPQPRWDRIEQLLLIPKAFEGPSSKKMRALLLKIVEFQPDPRAAEKAARAQACPEDWTTILQPQPRFDTWAYRQVLARGVCPLAQSAPFEVASVLVEATASMLRLRAACRGEQDEEYADVSTWQYSRLDELDEDVHKAEGALINALTVVCDAVYGKAAESIHSLDQSLRNSRWDLFARLRQLLYSRHLTSRTLPWIRECIISKQDYGTRDYRHEFRLMVRKACEHFGEKLLCEKEREKLFNMILEGGLHEATDFSDLGVVTHDTVSESRRLFHLRQLRPFKSLLFGDYAKQYALLEKAFREEDLPEERDRGVTVGTVTSRSPYTEDALSALNDEELLKTVNEWDNSHRDPRDWLVEVTVEALASTFQSVFRKAIAPNSARREFWLSNAERIARPAYVRAMLRAMEQIIKEKDFEHLDRWLAFCGWVLGQPNGDYSEEGSYDTGVRDVPDWRWSRRAVGDFLGCCLQKGVDAPITARERISRLLKSICTGFDYWLDRQDAPVLVNSEAVDTAINHTRSRALESVVDFGYWVRRCVGDGEVAEVRELLGIRFDQTISPSLTIAERAILGLCFVRVWDLDKTWAAENRALFFPREEREAWREAFSAYLRFNRPFLPTFELLREDFQLALSDLPEMRGGKETARGFIDTLGQHLFTYFLWGAYPLEGEGSLLEVFYERTSGERQYWARLLDHVGRALKNSGRTLEEGMVVRVTAFFEWRLQAGEQKELGGFSSWLEAACLEEEWRLRAFSKVLDVARLEDSDVWVSVGALAGFLDRHTGAVVECFAKITDAIGEDRFTPIRNEEAKMILQRGFASGDETIQLNAQRARENLLKARRFEFLEGVE